MKRSASVALTVVAALAELSAQQAADPCNPATFSAKVCRSAVRGSAFCSHGGRVPTTYSQKYPYYYDRYRAYLSQGGAVAASPAEVCPSRGGFGHTAAIHGSALKAHS